MQNVPTMDNWKLSAPEPPSANGDRAPGVFKRISTGIQGLDEVLGGGLIPGRTYLLRGGPGTGKTTAGLHFLSAGAMEEEPVLFITLVEPEEQLRNNAASLNLNLQGVQFLDLSPPPEFFTEVLSYDIFTPAEVEREPTTRRLVETVEKLRPRRVFLDAMTQFRYLATDTFQFRKEVLSFLRFLLEQGATVLFTSEASEATPDDDLQFMADGVLCLAQRGTERFTRVTKFRGSEFVPGDHSLVLGPQGMEVFPRLLPASVRRPSISGLLASGVPELDALLHGGLERATVTLITGPAGVGRSTVALQFLQEAAGRGERAAAFLFDEAPSTVLARCHDISLPLQPMIDRGLLALHPVEPLRVTPDQLAAQVRREVEEHNTRVVLLDSISGYRLSLGGRDLIASLHALGEYLRQNGVTLLVVSETGDVLSEAQAPDLGITYLADSILFLRYIEMGGELHKAIGVLKKRLSDFEKSLREVEITRYGLQIGRPLTELRGMLRRHVEYGDLDRAPERR